MSSRQAPLATSALQLKAAGRFIGMDEAGYGPNLGPLVLCATVWETPSAPDNCDFYALLADAVCATADRQQSRVHIADSKQVHSPSHGIAALELSALSLLGACGIRPRSFRELVASIRDDAVEETEPWYEGCDLELPLAIDPVRLAERLDILNGALLKTGIALQAIRAAVVEPREFNEGLARHGNKAELLTRTAFRLLRGLWDPAGEQPTLVVGDKHGGRNRYDTMLSEVVDGALVLRFEEQRELSRYRVGRTELRFQMQGERHLPVASGSIVAKYVRELSMELFNRYWRRHLPELKPTKGYPADAERFFREIQGWLGRLGIEEAIVWRRR